MGNRGMEWGKWWERRESGWERGGSKWECRKSWWKFEKCGESRWEWGDWGANAGNQGANARNQGGNAGNQGDSLWESSCLLLRLKSRRARGSISPSSIYGQLSISHTFFCLAYQVDEFSFKDMRMRGQSKISYSCICAWSESGELGRRRSSRFLCVTPVVETSSGGVTFKIM